MHECSKSIRENVLPHEWSSALTIHPVKEYPRKTLRLWMQLVVHQRKYLFHIPYGACNKHH